MSKLLLAVDYNYTDRLTWRGHLALNNIKSKFQDLQLLERVRTCLFKQFFQAPALRFSGVIIHQLLLRKIKFSSRNEIHFEVVARPMKFGIGEYALITGLNFGPYPEEKVPHNTKLVSTHLSNNNIVKSHELEAIFTAFKDKEAARKLGLVHFVDGVLYSHDPNSKVDIYLFSLVEHKEDFFQVPFWYEVFSEDTSWS